MDNSWIFGLVGSTTGIVVGWFLTRVSQYFEQKKEEKKNLRIAIFGLLEVYYALIRLDNKDLLEKAMAFMKNEFKNKFNIDLPEKEMKKFFAEMIDMLIKEAIIGELKSAGKYYHESIVILKPIDPIIAFRLNGKESNFEKIEGILNKLTDIYIDDGDSMLDELTEFLKNVTLEISTDDIKEVLLKLARKINRKTFRDTQKTIGNITLKNDDRYEQFLSDWFQKVADTIDAEQKE